MKETCKQNIEQLTQYIDFMHNLYEELLTVANSLDVNDEHYLSNVDEQIVLEFDMRTSFIDEDIEDKYVYHLCETMNRTYRSALYMIAVDRYNAK